MNDEAKFANPDGSFVPLGRAGQKVVIDLNERRPAARKALQEDLAKVKAGMDAGMSAEEVRAMHAAQEQQAILVAMTRLARYTSINECVAFVEGALLKMGGPR